MRKRNFNAELINNSIIGCCEWLMGIKESFTLALISRIVESDDYEGDEL